MENLRSISDKYLSKLIEIIVDLYFNCVNIVFIKTEEIDDEVCEY